MCGKKSECPLPVSSNDVADQSRLDLEQFLHWRHIDPEFDTVCRDCGGSGVKTYSSTATWRGGVGGQAITSDVCDRCWGSGCENRPWTNLRKLQSRLARTEASVAE